MITKKLVLRRKLTGLVSWSNLWDIRVSPDEIAKELLKRHKHYGIASSAIRHLVLDAIYRRYPTIRKSLEPLPREYNHINQIILVEKKYGSWVDFRPYHEHIFQPLIDWIRAGNILNGHNFIFTHGHADLPDTLSIHEV